MGDLRASGPVDGAAHTAPGHELGIGGVHDGVDRLLGDVAKGAFKAKYSCHLFPFALYATVTITRRVGSQRIAEKSG
jgi:hypothetical protein